jgi:hypothetical protein
MHSPLGPFLSVGGRLTRLVGASPFDPFDPFDGSRPFDPFDISASTVSAVW